MLNDSKLSGLQLFTTAIYLKVTGYQLLFPVLSVRPFPRPDLTRLSHALPNALSQQVTSQLNNQNPYHRTNALWRSVMTQIHQVFRNAVSNSLYIPTLNAPGALIPGQMWNCKSAPASQEIHDP
ncbi:hypothetical protein EHF33_15495 [Deinococcus psychrotolerans]|uniref:Uncharacterized protein n=1 Tax=Deinococcus psychrotolerans TaxID=2489213 RepID=A0A3G8YG65_9DEIO|nr:hypothetical protein [Deinococcus psychrotolerans]AZI44292.1 hypothetical protein EHF33_15495 [Deinococcus psychrotolerans]